MALNKHLRQQMLLGRKAALGGEGDAEYPVPKLAEVKVDVDAKDFDTALAELVQKAEAIVAIAPENKADKLQGIADMLKQCQAEEEAVESPEEESQEGEDSQSDNEGPGLDQPY